MCRVFICCSALFLTMASAHLLPIAPLYGTEPLVKSAFVAAPTHVEVHEPGWAKLGNVLETVPTAVSHQSSTVVHSKAQRITPLLTPAVRSYTAPAVRTYAAPLLKDTSLVASPLSWPLVGTTAFTSGWGPAATFVHARAPTLHLGAFGEGAASFHRSYGFNYGAPVIYAATNYKK